MTARRVGNVVVVVICLIAVIVINAVSRDEAPGERWYRGRLGEWVTSPRFDVRVDAVELATQVSDGPMTLDTQGVFVVVHWSAAVKGRTAYFGKVHLLTGGGLTVAQRGEFKFNAGVGATDAGFTTHGASVFEVQPEQVHDLALRVDHDRGVFFSFSGGVEVSLPADGQTPVAEIVTLPAPSSEVTR